MTRAERWEAVQREYVGSCLDPDPTPERFALALEDESGLRTVESFDSLSLALAYAGADVLDGTLPRALFDLETGESFGLHVSTIVTTSTDAMPEPAPWSHDACVCGGTGDHEGQDVATCDECDADHDERGTR